MRRLLSLLPALLLGCRDVPAGPHPEAKPQATQAVQTRPTTLDLVEFTTAGASADQPLPLVLALHGLGDRPESFGGWLRALPGPARVYVLRAPLPWGQGFSWFKPTSRGGPVDPEALGPGVAEAVALLRQELDPLVARKPTRGKPIVTGFSQGGMISFALLAAAPDRVAAAFPIGGVLPASAPIQPPPPAAPRLFAFHGAADERVPEALARGSIDRLKAAGWTAELRSYPGVGHSIDSDERRDILRAIAEVAAAQ